MKTKRPPLLQIIYEMVHTSVSDKTLATRFKLPLSKVQRYRLAVDRFYNGAEKEVSPMQRRR